MIEPRTVGETGYGMRLPDNLEGRNRETDVAEHAVKMLFDRASRTLHHGRKTEKTTSATKRSAIDEFHNGKAQGARPFAEIRGDPSPSSLGEPG